MFLRPALVTTLLLTGACTTMEATPNQTTPDAVPSEPILAIMDIGGVT